MAEHAIAKFSGHFLDNLKIKSDMVRICAEHHLNVLNIIEHEFWPVGYTVMFLLAESHFSFHSEPENNLAYLDCFTCGSSIDPVKVLEDLAQLMDAKVLSKTLLHRK